jgi:1,4-alpha-glucan branching enzyme
MAASQTHVASTTRMGANLVGGGATFRVWAPAARAVFVNGRFAGVDRFSKDRDDSLQLVNDGNGFWAGFLPGCKQAIATSSLWLDEGHVASSAIPMRVN